MPLLAATLAVVLNLLAAGLMGWIAGRDIAGVLLVFGILVIFGLNGLRFVLWGAIHRRFPISKAYPLTAVFFPLLALIEWYKGEVIVFHQWVGIGLITLGVLWITLRVEDTRRERR